MKISMQCEDCKEQVVWWLHGQRRLDATAARLASVATGAGAIGGATICVSIKRVWSAGRSTVVSEYVKLPACNLCHLPPEISYVDAAVTADAIATPVHVLREHA